MQKIHHCREGQVWQKKKEIMCRKKAKHIDDLAKHIDNSVRCYIPVVCGPGGLSPS